MNPDGRRRLRWSGWTGALLAATLCLILAAAANAEVRSGSGTDPAETGVPGGLDLTAVSVSYDTAGTISAQLTTREPPGVDPKAGLAVGFGVLEGNECEGPFAVVLNLDSRPPTAVWSYAGSEAAAQIAVSGATTILSATGSPLAGQAFNCAEAFSYVYEKEEVTPLDVIGPLALFGPPPPLAAPAPPATPAPAAPSAPAPTPPPPASPTPKVPSLAFQSKTVTVHRNVGKKVTVKITNTGTAAAGRVALKIGRAKGVVLRPRSGELKLKSIAAGKSKFASFTVLLTRKGKSRSKLKLTLSGAHGAKASGLLTVEIPRKAPPNKKGKGKEPPPPAVPPLAEKIFYTYESQASESSKLIGYAFIDGEWAYHGIPAEGLPVCTSATTDGSKASASGCVKYTYDPASGAVKIGSASGKLNPGGELEVDGETYSATSILPADSKLQVEQEYLGYVGLCGFITGCSTFHEQLLLTSSGEFVLAHESLTTVGGSGPGETFVAAGSYPADEHGTYAIEKGARIKLSYADGTTQTKTFAIFLNKEGKPDPTYAGLLVGTEYFTFANDE